MASKGNPRRLIRGQAVKRSGTLLDMLYTTSEIADVFGVERRTVITQWLAAGAPHSKDDRGRYWFNGREVAEWVKRITPPERAAVPTGLSYCLKCKTSVQAIDLKPKSVVRRNGLMLMERGTCPKCGSTVHHTVGAEGITSWSNVKIG